MFSWIFNRANLVKQSSVTQSLIRKLGSYRVIWNWAYLSYFLVLCTYVVLKYPATATTVVTVCGGVVSVIFTGYVASKAYERGKGVDTTAITPVAPTKEKSEGA